MQQLTDSTSGYGLLSEADTKFVPTDAWYSWNPNGVNIPWMTVSSKTQDGKTVEDIKIDAAKRLSKPTENSSFPHIFVLSTGEVQRFLSGRYDGFDGWVTGSDPKAAFTTLETCDCNTHLRDKLPGYHREYTAYMDKDGIIRPCHHDGTRLHYFVAGWAKVPGGGSRSQ
jgi:hypothetical protein